VTQSFFGWIAAALVAEGRLDPMTLPAYRALAERLIRSPRP